jgi:hypothetical protein
MEAMDREVATTITRGTRRSRTEPMAREVSVNVKLIMVITVGNKMVFTAVKVPLVAVMPLMMGLVTRPRGVQSNLRGTYVCSIF